MINCPTKTPVGFPGSQWLLGMNEGEISVVFIIGPGRKQETIYNLYKINKKWYSWIITGEHKLYPAPVSRNNL